MSSLKPFSWIAKLYGKPSGLYRFWWHWYTEHALERMAPRTPEVMAELEKRALERAAKEGYLPQTEKFAEWMKKHGPDPRNIPPSVVEAEIANSGSTNIRVELNTKGEVITVIPRG